MAGWRREGSLRRGIRPLGLWLLPAGLLVVLTAGLPHRAAAQDPASAGGWVEFGLGGGWGQVTCAICSGHRRRGVEARVGAGTWLRSGVGLGAEASGWVTSDDPARQILGTIHVFGEVRPAGGPVHARVGLGTGHYRGLETGDSPDLEMLALSARLEVGAEALVGGRTRVRPVLSANLAGFGTLRRGDRVVWEGAGFNLLRGGLSVSRSGGPRGGR